MSPGDELLKRFLVLYNGQYRRLYLFARSLMPGADDVDDVMQEVGMVLWKKFGEFRPDSDFRAWAFQMIYIEVLRWQKNRKRERRLLDEEFLRAVAGKLASEDATKLDRRYDMLIECTEKLSGRMKAILGQRYFMEISVPEIARRSQSSIDTVYQRLSRLRATLRECVEKKMVNE